MQDKTLTCKDCGCEFVFTVGEQEFFAQKGYTNDPGRCPQCRAARKSSREGSGSRSSYGSTQREMFPAVCATCGQETQVPFQPRSDRPVYCLDCYRAQRGSSDSSFGQSNAGRNRY